MKAGEIQQFLSVMTLVYKAHGGGWENPLAIVPADDADSLAKIIKGLDCDVDLINVAMDWRISVGVNFKRIIK